MRQVTLFVACSLPPSLLRLRPILGALPVFSGEGWYGTVVGPMRSPRVSDHPMLHIRNCDGSNLDRLALPAIGKTILMMVKTAGNSGVVALGPLTSAENLIRLDHPIILSVVNIFLGSGIRGPSSAYEYTLLC
jgi:hypothetical protein